MTWNGPLKWKITFSWGTSVYLEFTTSRWSGCTGSDCDYVYDGGVMPVLRFHALEPAGNPVYIDLGIGGHLISQTHIAAQVYSTAFQFGEIAGFGCMFGRYDIGLRYQHESNGNIKLPNDGMTTCCCAWPCAGNTAGMLIAYGRMPASLTNNLGKTLE